MNDNFWKNQYSGMWDAAEKRENYMIKWINDNTGLIAETYGLGAGTSKFIEGSAEKNGFTKGDADLHIINTNIYIEVTGPLSEKVSINKPLWFRPDKFQNAIRNKEKGHDTFFAHHCPSKDLWRIIHIDDDLVARLLNNEFPIVKPKIRGNYEQYVEIPAFDECIKDLEFLKNYLGSL